MGAFLQAAGGVLVGVVLISMLSARDKSISSLMSMGVCAMVLLVGLTYLEPVVTFLGNLEMMGNLQPELVKILLKAGGIGILTEIVVLLCNDSGNTSLGQSIKILSSGVILWLSLPVFQALLDLIGDILGGFG